jgi:hypothetical protein
MSKFRKNGNVRIIFSQEMWWINMAERITKINRLEKSKEHLHGNSLDLREIYLF